MWQRLAAVYEKVFGHIRKVGRKDDEELEEAYEKLSSRTPSEFCELILP